MSHPGEPSIATCAVGAPASLADRAEARTAFLWAVIASAFAAVLAATGLIFPPWSLLQQYWGSVAAVLLIGQLGFDIFLFWFCSRPGVKWQVRVVALALAATGLTTVLLPYSAAKSLSTFYHLTLVGLWLGVFCLGLIGYSAWRGDPASRERGRLLLLVACVTALFSGAPYSFLDLTVALHPATFDGAAFHLDQTLGFQPSVIAALVSAPFIGVLTFVYTVLPFGVPVLYGDQLSSTGGPRINILVVWLSSAFFALAVYHLCPIAGPTYAFGTSFPAYMPAPETVPFVPTLITAMPRNGLPSMHFAWALLLWMAACRSERSWLRHIFAAFAGMTFLATLALGQHYLIDLVVSVPMSVAFLAIGLRGFSWTHPAKRHAVVVGLAAWLAWVFAVRFGVPLFQAVPGLTWLAVAATVGAGVHAYRKILAAERDLLASPTPVAMDQPVDPATRSEVRRVAAMFVLSGFAGLMYQVLFSKALALTFGSTATANYTVLATYMGGMAIGAWLGGRLASRRNDPLILYAFCELGIGIYCIATPGIFNGIQGVYVALAGGVPPDAGILTGFRLGLGVLALLVPTVLMGMTLPILARFFEARSASLGRSVAMLYGANTIGAALGALLAGYAVLPVLGVHKSTLIAALANMLVALLAIELHKRVLAQGREVSVPDACVTPATASREDRKLGVLALVALTVGGVVTLALEVNYIHLLAVVAGNSTYAFSLMLFTFLLGLGAGAEAARRLLKQGWALPTLFALLEFGLAGVILAGTFLWTDLSGYFASFQGYPREMGFGAREAVRGAVCFVAMFPPAFMIGALYPVTMECIGRARPAEQVRALGAAAALNTFGNIAGVLLGGFLMLPLLGALKSVQVLAVVCLALGVMVLLVFRPPRPVRAWAPAAAVLGLLVGQPAGFDYSALASGANVYFSAIPWGQAIDHAESVDGGLTTVVSTKHPDGSELRTLLTNGKFQGNNALEGEMKAQVGFAAAPLLHTSRRERAMVIGYGTGVTTRTLHEAGFAQVDVVELSADILRLANKHFENVNRRASEQPGVTPYVTDGRNFLLLQDRKYDVIGMEVSSIWFAGAASLYNKEFYALAKKRLAEGGVLQQWIQLHHIMPEDVLRIIGSVRAEFRHVWLYLIGGQGIIVASNDPRAGPDEVHAARLDATVSLAPLLALYGGSAKALMQDLLLDPPAVDRMLNDFGVEPTWWVSTDDNLFLEYSTPRGNALDAAKSIQDNVRFLKSYNTIYQGPGKPLKAPTVNPPATPPPG